MVSKLPTAPGVYIWKGGARDRAARQPDSSLSSLADEMKAMSVDEDSEDGPEEGMRDGWEDVLYVGKAKNLRKRVDILEKSALLLLGMVYTQGSDFFRTNTRSCRIWESSRGAGTRRDHRRRGFER